MSSFKIKTRQTTKSNIKIDDVGEFPELLHKNIMSNSTSDLNFLEASQRTASSFEKKETLKPGWVELSIDPQDNSVIWRKHDNDTSTIDEHTRFQANVKHVIATLIFCWERYKKNYEELNGEDAYEYNYCSYPTDDGEEDTEE
jgi:hypothetical protein